MPGVESSRNITLVELETMLDDAHLCLLKILMHIPSPHELLVSKSLLSLASIQCTVHSHLVKCPKHVISEVISMPTNITSDN